MGFIVAPWAKQSIKGYIQYNSRVATLRIRVEGGVLTLINVYAWANTHDFDTRHDFFTDLVQIFAKGRSHGPTILLGDLNARLLQRYAGEEDVIGDFVYHNHISKWTPTSNRELLVELCTATDTCIANTFFDVAAESKVTYYDIGAHPMDTVLPGAFEQLDHVVLDPKWLPNIRCIWSDRGRVLQSHHFLNLIDLEVNIPKQKRVPRPLRYDWTSLRNSSTAKAYAEQFVENWDSGAHSESIEGKAERIATSMMESASQHVPVLPAAPHRPWISARTLQLIAHRNTTRLQGERINIKTLNKQIQVSARADKKKWLNDAIDAGGWQAIRALRKKKSIQQGRLRDMNGALVESGNRANTMADYLEQVQWKLCEGPEVLPHLERNNTYLNINTGGITLEEVRRAIKSLRVGKAAGNDGTPPDLWQVLWSDDTALEILRDLCSSCWVQKRIPESWREASIVTIFKNGDTSEPSNYRPTSLLAVGYKVLASIILHRLKTGGVEKRLRESQYGFRPDRGTSDALFLARRLIDATLEDKHGALLILLLDWSKAFDRINPDGLLHAFREFQIPAAMIDMIQGIYTARKFVVREGQNTSSQRPQNAGIAQGCPLSPYIFIILMSVLMEAVDNEMNNNAGTCTKSYLVTWDILYADDTMFLADKPDALQRHLDLVAKVGKGFGLELNEGKTILMRIRSDAPIFGPGGEEIQCKSNAIYLGGLLSSDGNPHTELTRRLGEAKGAFQQLCTVWNHAKGSRQKKSEYWKHVYFQRYCMV